MILNAFGCAFIHNWIKLNRSNRFHKSSLLRQVVFETYMLIQNCMLIMLALTIDNKESLLNLEIDSRKGEIAAVSFGAFVLGIAFKVLYYFCLHPWPIFRNMLCKNMKENLKYLTEEQSGQRGNILGNVLSMLTFMFWCGLTTSIYLIFSYMGLNQNDNQRKTLPSHQSSLLILISLASAIFLLGILFNAARPKGTKVRTIRKAHSTTTLRSIGKHDFN